MNTPNLLLELAPFFFLQSIYAFVVYLLASRQKMSAVVHVIVTLVPVIGKIGRASCRERVSSEV